MGIFGVELMISKRVTHSLERENHQDFMIYYQTYSNSKISYCIDIYIYIYIYISIVVLAYELELLPKKQNHKEKVKTMVTFENSVACLAIKLT